MQVVDPGHEYQLASLDGELQQSLVFVKREGPGYPGNVGHHPGTTTQDVLRCLIERLDYVNAQEPSRYTAKASQLLRAAIYLLETRAAERHQRKIPVNEIDACVRGDNLCVWCQHHGCQGACRAGRKQGVTQ